MLKRRIALFLLVSLMIFNLCTVAEADETTEGTKKYIEWSTLKGKGYENLNSIAYGSDRFVAVGTGGAIRVSEDRENWRKIEWNGSAELHKIIYNGSFFVVVGENLILRSTDGLKWEKVLELHDKLDYGQKFDNVAWNGKCLYAFGPGRLYSSKDGIAWVKSYEAYISQTSGGNFSGTFIDSIAFSKGGAVAMAIENNFRIVMTTENGSTWSKKNAPNISYRSHPPIYFTGKYFVVQGLDKIMCSEDGTTWSFREKQSTFTPSWVKSIGGMLYGSDGMSLYTSEDGFTWKETGLANSKTVLRDIAQDEAGGLVVVGDSELIVLCDAEGKWAPVDMGVYYPTNSTATDGEILAAVGDHGQILVTKDGAEWDRMRAVTDKKLLCIVYAEKRFVAGGEDGEILFSEDGYNWSKAENSSKSAVRAMAYGAGRFVAVGEKGLITTSEDGEKWKEIDSAVVLGRSYEDYEFMAGGIVFNGKVFLVVTGSCTLRSLDGIAWEKLRAIEIGRNDAVQHSFWLYETGNLMVWDGKRVLMATHDGIMQTEDGEKWFHISEGYKKGLHYENGLYIWGHSISSDACSWVPAGAGYGIDSIRKVAGFKGKLYAFGEEGVILRGQILSLPEAATANMILAYAFSRSPIPLEESILAYNNKILFLPVDVISGLIEGQWAANSNNSFTLSKNDTVMVFSDKSNMVNIDGKAVKLPAVCYLSGKKLLVPADFVLDQLNFKIEYYPNAKILNTSYKYVDNKALIEWNKCMLPKGIFTIHSMAWNGESYALFASTEKGSCIATSKDGINWSKAADIDSKSKGSLFAIGNRFVLVCTEYSRNIETGSSNSKAVSYFSDGGSQWLRQEDSTLPLFRHYAASNGNTAVIIGADGWLYRTKDGIKWEKTAQVKHGPENIKWEGNQFMLIERDDICISSDEVEWSFLEELSTLYNKEIDIESGAVSWSEWTKSAGKLGDLLYAVSTKAVYIKGESSGWEKVFSLPNAFPAIIGQIEGQLVIYINKLGAAAGEDSVMIYRTADGKVWENISSLNIYIEEHPDSDKLITFTEGQKLFFVGINEIFVGHMK